MARHEKSPTGGTPPSGADTSLHTPLAQDPPVHLTLHPPQLLRSVAVLTQTPLQGVRVTSEQVTGPPSSPLVAVPLELPLGAAPDVAVPEVALPLVPVPEVALPLVPVPLVAVPEVAVPLVPVPLVALPLDEAPL